MIHCCCLIYVIVELNLVKWYNDILYVKTQTKLWDRNGIPIDEGLLLTHIDEGLFLIYATETYGLVSRVFPGPEWAFVGVTTHDSKHDRSAHSESWAI